MFGGAVSNRCPPLGTDFKAMYGNGDTRGQRSPQTNMACDAKADESTIFLERLSKVIKSLALLSSVVLGILRCEIRFPSRKERCFHFSQAFSLYKGLLHCT
jgi:hypothetical protein